jgi:hypothetical protein
MAKAKAIPEATERRSGPRRGSTYSGPSDEPYLDHEREFLLTVEKFKRDNRRPFPSLVELLQIVERLIAAGKFDQRLGELGFERKPAPESSAMLS